MLLWCCDLQKQIDVEPFGPNLADVEKQIAAHNILHQAIQSYSTQLTPDSITSQVHVYNSRVIWWFRLLWLEYVVSEYVVSFSEYKGRPFIFRKIVKRSTYWIIFIQEVFIFEILYKIITNIFFKNVTSSLLWHLTRALLLFLRCIHAWCLRYIVSYLFRRGSTPSWKKNMLNFMWVQFFNLKFIHEPDKTSLNAHREMMMLYLLCLFCRRALNRGKVTWPLCMNTCRAAVKS